MEATRTHTAANDHIRQRAGAFRFSIVDEQTAANELNQLRAGKSGRVSKYAELAKECEQLGHRQVLATEMAKNEVGGFRGYLTRQFGERFEAKSAKQDDGNHAVYVFRVPAQLKKAV